MKRKVLAMMMSLTLALAVTACGGSDTETDAADTAPEQPTPKQQTPKQQTRRLLRQQMRILDRCTLSKQQ